MPITLKHIKRIVASVLWALVAVGCITLLAAAVKNKETKYCNGVDITITGVNNIFFIDKSDVYAIIKNYGGDSTEKKSLAAIDLKLIEKELKKDVWVKNAELYFDNNNILKVFVEEREPIARIFTIGGNSFYIDSSCMVLPLSTKFSARLPIITSYVSDNKVASKADSAVLNDIKNISIKIAADTFLMALIEQIDILPNRTFEMTPKIGKQVIIFGDATDIDLKLSKLKMFYKNIMTLSGWNKYSKINLQYKNQVVASIRGAEDIASDSLRTLLLIKAIAENAAAASADSSQVFLSDASKNNADSSMINQSVEREDEGINPTSSGQKPLVVLPITLLPSSDAKRESTKPVAVKPTVVKQAVNKPTMVLSKKIVVPAKPPAKKTAKKPIPKETNEY